MLRFRRLSVVVAALAGLCLSAATGRAVEPRLLPANTEIVFSINIKQMLESDIIKGKAGAIQQLQQGLQGKIPNADEITKYLEKAGFDPLRDLVSVSIAHPGTKDDTEGVVIIEGNFNAKKIAAAADDAIAAYGNQLEKAKFDGTTYYKVSANDKTAYVVLLGKSIVISPKKSNIEGAITRSTGNRIVATKVRELLKATNANQSLSLVLNGDALKKAAEQIPQLKGGDIGNVLGNIEGISGAITLTKDINFQLGIGASDAKSAREIADQGKKGLLILSFLAQAQAQQNADLAPLVEVVRTLRVSSVGANAILTGSVTQENLEKLLKTLGKLKGGF